jgi:carbonic anhydrase
MRTFNLSLALALALSGVSLNAAELTAGQESLGKLIAGNSRYSSNSPTHPHLTPERRAELERGQSPFAVILTCADSRVSPEFIFDQGLGDLFVVRVAGNILDDSGLGSIEYAVDHLHASLVVVLGHQDCGAVKATLEGGHAPGHIQKLVKAIKPAVKSSKSEAGNALDNAVRANVNRVVGQLRATPLLHKEIEAGKLKVVGARYDLHTGKVDFRP